jgi:hypothetical protein
VTLPTQHCTTTEGTIGCQWEQSSDKGRIKFLENHVTKHNKNINLKLIPILCPNIDKWIANEEIDNEISNKFWTNKNIIDSLNMPSIYETWSIHGERHEAIVLW